MPRISDSQGNEAKLNSDGSLNTKLVGSLAKLDRYQYLQSINVPVGGNVIVEITPPLKEIWTIKNMPFVISGPSGATSGTHKIEIFQYQSYPAYLVYSLQANYNAQVRNNLLSYPDSVKAPLLGLMGSNDVHIFVKYTNNTDAVQTGALEINILKEVNYIA